MYLANGANVSQIDIVTWLWSVHTTVCIQYEDTVDGFPRGQTLGPSLQASESFPSTPMASVALLSHSNPSFHPSCIASIHFPCTPAPFFASRCEFSSFQCFFLSFFSPNLIHSRIKTLGLRSPILWSPFVGFPDSAFVVRVVCLFVVFVDVWIVNCCGFWSEM